MNARIGAAAGLIVGIAVAGVLIDQLVGPQRGILGGPRPLDAGMVAAEVARAGRGFAVGLAVVGAWLVARGRGPALIGLGLSVALLAGGAVWPWRLVGSIAAEFAWPLVAAMVARVIVEFARKEDAGSPPHASSPTPLERRT